MKQEELTSYEVGTKLSLLDRKLQLNAAGFYYDYRDKQFLTYEPYPVTGYNQILKNIPKSKVKGVEAKLSVYPVEGLSLRGAVTYIKTEVGEFPTYNGRIQPINVKGSEFNFAPPWSGTLDAEYQFPVSTDLKAYVGGGMLFNTRTYNDLGEDPITKIPGYELFDARVGLRSDKNWNIGLFVRNLTNKYYYTAVFRTAEVYAKIAGMPRTYGAFPVPFWKTRPAWRRGRSRSKSSSPMNRCASSHASRRTRPFRRTCCLRRRCRCHWKRPISAGSMGG